MRRRSLKSALFTFLLFLALIAGIRWFGDPLPAELTGIAKAVDGDSLLLDGYRIRLIGLDAPEYAQICSRDGRDVACGDMARRALEDLVGGRSIGCRIEGKDRYSRLLARCYRGANDLGEALVTAGWAIAADDYRSAEAAARLAQAGLWSMEFIDPADWRKQKDGAGDRGSFWSWF